MKKWSRDLSTSDTNTSQNLVVSQVCDRSVICLVIYLLRITGLCSTSSNLIAHTTASSHIEFLNTVRTLTANRETWMGVTCCVNTRVCIVYRVVLSTSTTYTNASDLDRKPRLCALHCVKRLYVSHRSDIRSEIYNAYVF